MNVVSLFTGIGGFDEGLERAGFRVVAQCEISEYCRRVLAKHWPGVPCFEDVREVTSERVRERLRQVDQQRVSLGGADTRIGLVCGGSPCQDLSAAGLRQGLDGERSRLFFELARVAGELLEPGGWFFFENVPGLFSSPPAAPGRDFAIVLATLAHLGFHDLAYRTLDSRYFRVPQRRRRVYIVARRAVGSGARQVLLEPESGGGDFAPGIETGSRVAASLVSGSHGAGVNPPGRRQSDDINIVSAPLKQRDWRGSDSDANGLVSSTLLGHRGNGGGGLSIDETFVTHSLTAEGFDASEDRTGRGTPLVAGTVRTHMRPGSASEDLAITGPVGGGNDGSGRRSEDDPNLVCEAPHTDGVREASGLPGRLDGGVEVLAPIDDVDPQPDGPRYSACGNAATVPVIEWIGRRIMAWEAAT